MISNRSKGILVISLTLLFSMACILTGREVEPAGNTEDTIATSVAATVEDGDKAPQPTWTVPPAVDDSSLVVDIHGVSFSFDSSLADSVNGEIVPGQGDPNNDMWSTPDHRMLSFSGWLLADAFHVPAIRIYPAAEFSEINSNVSELLDTLSADIDTQPADGGSIAVADLFNAAQFIRSQVSYIQFQNGRGVRYISQYGQAAYPIGWPNLFYTFQGFTDDGSYYISVILPVTHSSLPNPDDVDMDDAFYDNYMDYAAATGIELNAKDPKSFLPSLIMLDAVIESMLISDTPGGINPDQLTAYADPDFPFMFSYPAGWDISADQFADSVRFSDPVSNTLLLVGRDWLCQGCLSASDVYIKQMETLEFQAEQGDFIVVDNRPILTSTGDDAYFSSFEWTDFDDIYHWQYSIDIVVDDYQIYFILQGDDPVYMDQYRDLIDEVGASFNR